MAMKYGESLFDILYLAIAIIVGILILIDLFSFLIAHWEVVLIVSLILALMLALFILVLPIIIIVKIIGFIF